MRLIADHDFSWIQNRLPNGLRFSRTVKRRLLEVLVGRLVNLVGSPFRVFHNLTVCKSSCYIRFLTQEACKNHQIKRVE